MSDCSSMPVLVKSNIAFRLLKYGLLVWLIVSLCKWSIGGEGVNDGAVKPVRKKIYKAGDEYSGVKLDGERSSSHKVLPAEVSVFESEIIKPADIRLLGYNHNWAKSEQMVVCSGTNQLSGDFLAAASGMKLPLNRMSGSCSQKFRWKQAIGAMDNRTAHNVTPWEKVIVRGLGPVEWVKSCLAIDPDCGFTWTLNFEQETAQDHADLAQFLTGCGDDEWSAKRISYGIEKPVKVILWELGNELDWGKHADKFYPVENYIKTCREAIAAVRAVSPDAKFAAHAATAPWSPLWKERAENGDSWKNWHRAVLRELGQEIDYIAFHPYYFGLPTSNLEAYMDVIRDDIKEIAGGDRIKVFVSEHGRWPAKPKDGRPWKVNWYTTNSLSGCLATAQFINRCLARPEVELAAYHCFRGGPWNVVNVDEEGRVYTTGIKELFDLMGQAFAGNVVKVVCDGDRTSANKADVSFTVCAMASNGGLQLILVNREKDASRELHFNFECDYSLVEGRIFTSGSMDDFNTFEKRSLAIKDIDVGEAPGAFGTYRLPSKSVVTLFLKQIK